MYYVHMRNEKLKAWRGLANLSRLRGQLVVRLGFY